MKYQAEIGKINKVLDIVEATMDDTTKDQTKEKILQLRLTIRNTLIELDK